MQSFTKENKVTVEDATSAGTSAVNSSAYDMAGYENITFLVKLGTAAANNSIKAQQDTASGMGSAADLEGTSNASDGTEKLLVVEVVKPRERYVRCVVTRGTSTTIDSITAIQSCPRSIPVDNDASTNNSVEYHVSPAEGTA